MKKNILITLSVFISGFAFSQDYKQKIAKATCDCVNSIKSESKDSKNLEAQLGICMLKVSMPYSKELKRDYNIDVSKANAFDDDKTIDEFAGQIGLAMVSECSDVFLDIMKKENPSEIDSQLLINGEITKIEKDNFVVFHIVGENKNLTKLYWVSNVESNLDLPKEYTNLINKRVNISYYTSEIFDAKINDYRNVNIISSLKTD
ncbi:hypothetical protein [Chryseobacterium potabilaquae]|uniref:Uncharacterized protein n=1 Tax=Chryseobacterium potabilaquae TaxID=2675057 RepID=A0A6N4XF05_9FLAO|nr:hypothetical protein [Chryseobacterium potabilaquae]CAA7197237.1 hypothetical protein CHRY9293_03290 [Chryseobacterium potabilaquae]